MKKKIHTDGCGNATGNSEVKAKRAKPKPYVQSSTITDYFRSRDEAMLHKGMITKEEFDERHP